MASAARGCTSSSSVGDGGREASRSVAAVGAGVMVPERGVWAP